MGEAGKRRSDRILTIIPIRAAVHDSSGHSFKEDCITVSLNKYGVCINLANCLHAGEIVLIRNLRNGIEEQFRVVSQLQTTLGGRREWGLEAIDPEIPIWGVEFTPPAEGDQPKILIRCGKCQQESFRSVSANAYTVLLQVGKTSLHCKRCDETTRWQPSDPLPGIEVKIPTEKVVPSTSERRKFRRVRLAMRLRLRDSKDQREIVQTLDVSKTGLSFISRREYISGEEVYFILPFDENRTPLETKGRIIRSQRLAVDRLYGVQYQE